jgi:ribosome maturation factor RimP
MNLEFACRDIPGWTVAGIAAGSGVLPRAEGVTPVPEPLTRDQLAPRVEAALGEAGFELVAMKLVPRGGGLSVQIYIDHTEGSAAVTLDDCARASRIIQERVDLDRDLPGRYSLEVSSPGLNRLLTRPAHFRRFLGEPVVVRLVAEREGRRVVRGRITAADEQGVTLGLEGDEAVRLRYSEIADANLKVEIGKIGQARDHAPHEKE